MSKAPEELAALAQEAAEAAYAPYSEFCVGAALVDVHGGVHLGCNVENASYGLTICAERTAMTRAVASGVRTFVAIAIYADADKPCPPCGMCLGTLAEFCDDLEVHLFNGERLETTRLSELLPRRFDSRWL